MSCDCKKTVPRGHVSASPAATRRSPTTACPPTRPDDPDVDDDPPVVLADDVMHPATRPPLRPLATRVLFEPPYAGRPLSARRRPASQGGHRPLRLSFAPTGPWGGAGTSVRPAIGRENPLDPPGPGPTFSPDPDPPCDAGPDLEAPAVVEVGASSFMRVRLLSVLDAVFSAWSACNEILEADQVYAKAYWNYPSPRAVTSFRTLFAVEFWDSRLLDRPWLEAFRDLLAAVGERLTGGGELSGQAGPLQVYEPTDQSPCGWLTYTGLATRPTYDALTETLTVCRLSSPLDSNLKERRLEQGILRALMQDTWWTTTPPAWAAESWFPFDVDETARWVIDRYKDAGLCLIPDNEMPPLDYRTQDCEGLTFTPQVPSFQGCTPNDKTLFWPAFRLACRYIEGAFRFLDGVRQLNNTIEVYDGLTAMQVMWQWGWRSNGEASPSPRSYFGPIEKGDVGKEKVLNVWRILWWLRRKFEGTNTDGDPYNMEFRCDTSLYCTGQAYNIGIEIVLCDKWKNQPDHPGVQEKLESRARTIMHEPMHGLFHLRDVKVNPPCRDAAGESRKCYSESECLELHAIDEAAALDNINSYVLWAWRRWQYWRGCWPPARMFYTLAENDTSMDRIPFFGAFGRSEAAAWHSNPAGPYPGRVGG